MIKKFTLLFLMFSLFHVGYAQFFDSTDYRIIHLQDTVMSGTNLLHFKMTTNNNNSNSGYSDFIFIHQNGDTITSPTHWSMWLPASNSSAFDTTSYFLNYKLGVNSFPANFNGYLKVRNPECTIPFNFLTLSNPSIYQELNSINLFPNPAIDKLYISNNSKSKIDFIKIYSINGKLLSVNESWNNYLDISLLPQGIYLVKILSNQTFKTFKIQKN